MTKDAYKKAQILREQIRVSENNQAVIKKMESRITDAEFNELRQMAYDAYVLIIQKLELEFEQL